MKIGIMGGTFDPVHLAHLEMGREAKRQKDLDQIWFMPSKIPPHKRNRKIAGETIRYHWLESAVCKEKDFYVSDFELIYEKTTYTAETLERLRKVYPQDVFFFIMGGDSLSDFGSWYHPEKILAYAEILVFGRGEYSERKLRMLAEEFMEKWGGRIEVLSMKGMEISSSMIRKKLEEGQPVAQYLPETLSGEISTMREIYGKG